MDGKGVETAAQRGLEEGADGGAITERNDNELGLDNEAIGDGTLANGGQCRASLYGNMNNIPLVISDPFLDPFLDVKFDVTLSRKFDSMDKAAIDVMIHWNHSGFISKSVNEDEEYSGVIVQHKKDQKFSYSSPKLGFRNHEGKKASYPPHRFKIPKDVTLVAGYHTHGNFDASGTDQRRWDEGASNFSRGDMDYADGAVSEVGQLPVYLGTPRSEVKKYSPKPVRKGRNRFDLELGARLSPNASAGVGLDVELGSVNMMG